MEFAAEKLKKIRLEKGLSLEEVQKKTKIHLNILKALEGDSLTDLSPIYLKSFLKIYCKFLGVDPKTFIQDYKEIQTYPAPEIFTQDSSQPKKSATFLGDAALKLSAFRPAKKVRIAIVVIVILAIFSVGLFSLGKFIAIKRRDRAIQEQLLSSAINKKESRKLQKQHKTLPTAKSRLMAAKPSPKTAPSADKIQYTALNYPEGKKVSVAGIRLGIRAHENCWVDLKADGKTLFHRVLEKGRFESWQAKEKIELSLGNAGGVELEVNGQRFPNLGRKGQALKGIVVTKEGLRIPR